MSDSEQLNLEDSISTNGTCCPHCGAKMKSYWHKLTPILLHALVKMRACVHEKQMNKVHLQKDLDLSKNEYNNFQKLRFHGLIAHYKEDGKSLAGYWLLTERAGKFLRGEIEVPTRVRTYRNRVVERDSELVKIRDIIKEEKYLETLEDIEFEYMDVMSLGELM